MFIPDPDYYGIAHPGSGIPDPKTARKVRGEKKLYNFFFVKVS
jgi:hypothetical protein